MLIGCNTLTLPILTNLRGVSIGVIKYETLVFLSMTNKKKYCYLNTTDKLCFLLLAVVYIKKFCSCKDYVDLAIILRETFIRLFTLRPIFLSSYVSEVVVREMTQMFAANMSRVFTPLIGVKKFFQMTTQ